MSIEFMNQIYGNEFFGITLSLGAFYVGMWIYKKTKSPFLHPILIAMIIIIGILIALDIPLESYNRGGDLISLFLAPVTAVLAYEIYKQKNLLKEYFIPMMIGCLAGSITSLASVVILCHLFGLDSQIMSSMLAKSVTTPIAMEITGQLGGIPSLTVALVVLTGIMGAVFSPLFIKVLRIKNNIAAGVAIGTSSHAIGTSKAIEIGGVEGAMSGIAIGITGIITVLLAMIVRNVIM